MMRYGISFGFREIFFTHFHSDHMLGRHRAAPDHGAAQRVRREADRETADPLRPQGRRSRSSTPRSRSGSSGPSSRWRSYELKDGRRAQAEGVRHLRLCHRAPADTLGYALVEHDRMGRFDPDQARALGIPEGPLWGRIHKGEAITPAGRPQDRRRPSWSGPPRAGRTVVISGDTRPVGGAARGGAAAPTSWSTRRPSPTTTRAGPRDRPLHRPRGGSAGPRRQV